MNLNEKKLQLADLIVEIAQAAIDQPSCKEDNPQQDGELFEEALPSLGHQSSVPVYQVAPPSEEEVFLFQKAEQIAAVLNASIEQTTGVADDQAIIYLFSLLCESSTYVHFCYIWDRLNPNARLLFRGAFTKMKPVSDLSPRMKKYLQLK
jgi:hypothetical protein